MLTSFFTFLTVFNALCAALADWPSEFIGTEFPANGHLIDDRDLIDADARIAKIQLWCGQNTVYSMQPWYKDRSPVRGVRKVKHQQYSSNNLGGKYEELIINDDELITRVEYDACRLPGTNDLWAICYMYIEKSRKRSSQSGSVTCGQASHTGKYSGHPRELISRNIEIVLLTAIVEYKRANIEIGDNQAQGRVFYAFKGAFTQAGLVGLQTIWKDIHAY